MREGWPNARENFFFVGMRGRGVSQGGGGGGGRGEEGRGDGGDREYEKTTVVFVCDISEINGGESS